MVAAEYSHERRKKSLYEPAVIAPVIASLVLEIALGLAAWGSITQEVKDIHSQVERLETRIDKITDRRSNN